jgi:hypothetical protein
VKRHTFAFAPLLVLAATVTLGGEEPVALQRTEVPENRTAAVAVGAGGGFGLGLYLGLHFFDDAINSDRKVWTTAIIGAVAGGIIGHFISRDTEPGLSGPPATPRGRPFPDGSVKRQRAALSVKPVLDRAFSQPPVGPLTGWAPLTTSETAPADFRELTIRLREQSRRLGSAPTDRQF